MATKLRTQAAVEFVKLSDAIGVEARGLDLTQPLDDATARVVRRAWAENSILLVRDQDISEDDQFRYARTFGPIADRVKPPVEKRAWRADPENRMQLVTNRLDAEGRPLGSLGDGEMWFHTDKCYVERPHRASFLYAMELPSEGGHTKYASLFNAYDRLPAALKMRLEGRRVLQVYDYGKTDPADPDRNLDELLHYWQPLFVTNPDTGRRAVYVSRLMSLRIEGLEAAESADALATICEIIEQPDNIHEHVWRVGDLMGWDNLSCVHARTDWPREQPRSLRRCTVQGDRLA